MARKISFGIDKKFDAEELIHMEKIIKIDNISCGYTEKPVLADLSFLLSSADFAAIIGPNGAGKSTLLYAIMGFLRLQKGSVTIDGKNLVSYKRSELAKLIAYVPQEMVFQFDYTVQDIVLMGRYPWLKLMQSWTREDRTKVSSILESLELTELSQRFYSHLSGGEKQRVLIARALAQETSFIFLDETLSQLDINHQIEIIQMLSNIHRQTGKGILLVSHNLNLVANYVSTLIFLKNGKILGSGNPDQMMEAETLKTLFGIELHTILNPASGRINILYPGSIE